MPLVKSQTATAALKAAVCWRRGCSHRLLCFDRLGRDYLNFCMDTVVPVRAFKFFANNKPWITK